MAGHGWVQHISGQGEKYLVDHMGLESWVVTEPQILRLPMSDYVRCAPPEQWMDITGDCEVDEPIIYGSIKYKGEYATTTKGYRLRKVFYDGKWCAFIVEKKVQP